jgi:NAD+ synthase
MEERARKIADWIKEKVSEAGADGAIVGLSGGVDSSLVAALAKKALGNSMMGVIMPCNSVPDDAVHARMLAEKFDIRTETVDLGPVFSRIKESLPEGSKMAEANLKPRLRMLTLYYFANHFNYVVLGTDNKAELMAGYFTKYGDGGVDILPIASLYKREVREMASSLGVPDVIVKKAPSAGLWSGQTDENEMGISYDDIDDVLAAIDKGSTEGLDRAKVEKVKSMISRTGHKRKLPEICEV